MPSFFHVHQRINRSTAPFKQTSTQLPHEPTFLFSLFLILFRRTSLLCLCAGCVGRSGIRLQLARIQCLAQRHSSRLGDCYRGPRAQRRCPPTPTLTADMNFKASVLRRIFLSCTFVPGLSKKAESNQWRFHPRIGNYSFSANAGGDL